MYARPVEPTELPLNYQHSVIIIYKADDTLSRLSIFWKIGTIFSFVFCFSSCKLDTPTGKCTKDVSSLSLFLKVLILYVMCRHTTFFTLFLGQTLFYSSLFACNTSEKFFLSLSPFHSLSHSLFHLTHSATVVEHIFWLIILIWSNWISLEYRLFLFAKFFFVVAVFAAAHFCDDKFFCSCCFYFC